MNVPSFLEQARLHDSLRATLRRAVFHRLGREPTESELEVQVRQEFARMSRQLRGRLGNEGEEGSRPVAPAMPAQPAGSPVAGTWLSAEELAEAEAAIGYARSQGIDSLVDAARWYHDHRSSIESAPAIEQCVDEFLCIKRGEGYAPRSLKGYRTKLGRFAAAFPGRRPAEVSPHELGRFIVTSSLHPRTRLDWWATLHSFYSWCKRMRHVIENPLPQALAKPKPPPGSGLVLTPTETKTLLRAARSTDQIGFWVLALFAGVRTEELSRLQQSSNPWQFVRLRSRVIDLPHELAKTHARRIPILPVLVPWLKFVRDKQAPFFALNHFQNTHRLRDSVIADRSIVLTAQHQLAHPELRPPNWAYNIARRSYISYRLASAQASYVEIANEVGNSEGMIRANYARHVTRRDAEAYFSLTPDRL